DRPRFSRAPRIYLRSTALSLGLPPVAFRERSCTAPSRSHVVDGNRSLSAHLSDRSVPQGRRTRRRRRAWIRPNSGVSREKKRGPRLHSRLSGGAGTASVPVERWP